VFTDTPSSKDAHRPQLQALLGFARDGDSVALRELGRIERSLVTLDWLQSVELRLGIQAGPNKGEARNALARTVFFNRMGEERYLTRGKFSNAKFEQKCLTD
jgi:TnpA family transposase